MGKLTAIIVGYIATTFAAYIILSVSYNPLVNWLGPYFGYRFPFILGIIYLIVGSPLHNTIILEVWIIIGLLVGISTRKGLRAWGSASLVWTLTTITMALSAIAMLGISLGNITSVSIISGTVSRLLDVLLAATAFVPYSTNIATIATEPVLRVLIPYLSSSITSGTTGTAGLSGAITELSIHALENYIIFVATSIISGAVIHRVLHGKKKISRKAVAAAISIFIAIIFIAMAASAGISSGSQPALQTGETGNHEIPAVGLNTLFPLSISGNSARIAENNTVMPSYATGNNSSDQAALSLITPQGNLYNLFAMGSSSNNSNSIWSGNGLMLGDFIVSANMTSLIGSELGAEYSKLASFAPQNALILAYNGTGHSGSASSMASSIGKEIGTTFNPVVALKNITLSGNNVEIFIYSSSASIHKLDSDFMATFGNGYNGSGPEIFVTDQGLNNYNSYILSSGYINASIVKSLAGNTGINLSNELFTAGLFEYTNHFHSSGDVHSYNLSELMQYSSNISFNNSSQLSLVGIGYNNGTGSVVDTSNYTFDIYSNNASLAAQTALNTPGSTFHNSNYRAFSPSSVSVKFNAVFPAYILYDTTVKRVSANTVEINVHIKNNDTSQLKDFNASQSAFVNNYVKYGAASSVSGNYNESNITLSPGHYANFTYKISFTGIGTYVIPYTNISYNLQGKAFSYGTNATYISQEKPGYITAMNSMINNEASQYTFLGKTIIAVQGFAISLIDIILFAIVALDVVIEVKGLRKLIREHNQNTEK